MDYPVQDLVSQAYREPAVLFKDQMNYEGPAGGGFPCHLDATAYAMEDLAAHHISAMVAIDASTLQNGPLQVTAGHHNKGVLRNTAGVTDPEVEETLEFTPILTNPGDVVLFDSYLLHRSDSNTSNAWRRLAYLTFSRASKGGHHRRYYQTKIGMMKDKRHGEQH